MPREFDAAVQEIISQAQTSAVQALAEKYGFDAEEAKKFLTSEGSIKIVKKRGPVPKVKASKTKGTKSTVDVAKKPKRATTGYLMFSADQRADVRAEMEAEAEGVKLAPQAVVKELAKRWKALESDERDEWNQLAAVQAEPCLVAEDDDFRIKGGVGCTHVGMCSCGA